jgi:hypothetical protein
MPAAKQRISSGHERIAASDVVVDQRRAAVVECATGTAYIRFQRVTCGARRAERVIGSPLSFPSTVNR